MFFIIIDQIVPLFPNLESLLWNLSEAGHGKSAADGIGATMKRTADQIVAQEEDIADVAQFLAKVTERVKGSWHCLTVYC